jgi:hypothetical protein
MFSIAAAIIGALIGSFAGVLLTSSKTRRERGFDRRLQWCESMMGALNAAGAAVTSASTSRDPDGREECWTETVRLYEALIPLCGQKEIYAPQHAVELIQTFMNELAALIESHFEAEAKGTPQIACQACLDALRRAVGSLAVIARTHLGLEPLPDRLTDSTQRFLGSFRGRVPGRHQRALS